MPALVTCISVNIDANINTVIVVSIADVIGALA
jgi:hypothetical protein